MNLIAMAAAGISMLALGSTAVLAQASGDGRNGPRVFTGQALDHSLVALNDFLQTRYAHDDVMAALTAPAEADFRDKAVAVASAPDALTTQTRGGFDASISGDTSLDLHLAAFNDELEARGEPLFVRIALAVAGNGLDMTEAAGLAATTDDRMGFGPEIADDLTLDDHMLSLADHILEQRAKDLNLSDGSGAVTGLSFDRYGDALNMF